MRPARRRSRAQTGTISSPGSRPAAIAVLALDGLAGLASLVAGLAKPGDYVVCLGAGTITQWAYKLPEELAGRKGL